MLFRKISSYLDHFGIGVSLMCAIHCALLPLIITVLPLLGLSFIANPYFETAIILTSLIIGYSSMIKSFRTHANSKPLLLLSWGFVLILFGHFFSGEKFEWLFLGVGGLTVAAAHYYNWHLQKHSHQCEIDN